jgi:DNA repair protein RadC
MENTNQLQWQVSEVKLSYHPKVKATMRPKISNSSDSVAIFRQVWDDNLLELVEQFKVMLLNRANGVLGILDLSTGGMAATVADPKLIFMAALKGAATSIILAHNHPSGNILYSEADKLLTDKLKAAGQLLDLRVLDHIILTRDRYFSFADEGII